MRIRTTVFVLGCACLAATSAFAQNAPAPVTLGDLTLFGSMRAREYSWDWFGSAPGADYAYPAVLFRVGLGQNKTKYDWQVEVAVPVIAGLPTDAALPLPQGQLGLGPSYYVANGNSRTNASLFLKQAAFRFKELGGIAGQSLKAGRFEFGDGSEITPANASLAAIKRSRINERLIGTFGFTDVDRSFDGALYSIGNARTNVTAFASRPTEGVFQVDGWGELNINVFYGALTHEIENKRASGEWRVFFIGYQDYRNGVLKVDNRPLAARSADTGNVDIATYGAHYIEVANTSAGPVDVLLWGVLQRGSWGSLAQRSSAFAAEAGWQPKGLAWRPWIRGGYDYGSGDKNPNDGTHGTFFPILYTPRVYSRTPFFNQMNNEDGFVELTLRPTPRLALRSDAHAIRLASAADFWYAGGGAFQSSTFGYYGRASGNNTNLSNVYDIGPDITLNPRATVSLYYGHASANAIPQAIYSSTSGLNFFYAELFVHF